MTRGFCRAVWRESADGLEKHCNRCDEWWPADGEFFSSQPSAHRGLSSWCKACLTEDRNARRAQCALSRRALAQPAGGQP